MSVLKEGMRGTMIFYLQLALERAGFPTVQDGVFGADTCRQVRAFFQKEDCDVSEDEWEKLLPYLKGYTQYTIQPGDSLWTIAAKFQSDVDGIIGANPGIDMNFLRIGETITVPYSFSFVPEHVPYSSMLSEWITEGLKKRYPFLTAGEIGKSVMGVPISYISIGVGTKQVFYSASYHANEWITTPVLFKFAEEYARNFARNRSLGGVSAQRLYEEYTLFLVPLVNPDGVNLINGMLSGTSYESSAAQIAAAYPKIPFPDGWKANIEGVDLNLQFPAGWETAREIKFAQGYKTPAPRDYVGSAPLTAPESRAVYDFTKKHDFSLILAYHTQGETIYWKYLNYNPKNAYEIAQYFSEVSGYAVEETPVQSGYAGYKDWFILEYDRPGYTIEAGKGVNPLSMRKFPQIYKDNFGILLGGMTQLLFR